MKVFVVNCGSSSIKYKLFDMTDESVLAGGTLERVGGEDSSLTHRVGQARHEAAVAAPDHRAGMKAILDVLVAPDTGVVGSVDAIDAVGHRVVHGGEKVSRPARVDESLIGVIKEQFAVSPLHNPPNLAGIEAAREAMPDTPNVAVFDTAFFATMPPKAYRYAVPESWYVEHGVRRYGFHGTSHRYVTARTAELLGKPVDEVHLITTHLGNGCSMTAVAEGKAVDHSMGMTPLEGLIMGTRSGDIDPAVVHYMVSRGLSVEEINTTLNKKSGLLGLSGLSNDMRDLLEAWSQGNEKAQLAVEAFVHRVVKYVGSFRALLPAVDAAVLTGGIGENSVPVREMICRALASLGARFDPARNEATVGGKAGPVTADESALPVWVVPTDEERMIARDTRAVVEGV